VNAIRPGQIWEETSPTWGQPERIAIYGVSRTTGEAFFVPADPAKPVDRQSCRLFAFWPRDESTPETGRYRLVADSEDDPMVRGVTVLSIEYVRAWAAHVLSATR
jgi:hypothetical protein